MDLSLDIDDAGRFVATLTKEGSPGVATVIASNLNAADDLLAAIEEARESGLGECYWEAPGGEYRWMLRTGAEDLTLVVLWSTGVVTGWEHVFRGSCPLDWLAERIRESLARHGLTG
jgi:hypothetical protein